MDENQQATVTPSFTIERLYVKDLSVEVPHAPAVFLEQEAPQIDIQVGTEATRLNEEFFNVLLTVTVTAKLKEKTLFLIEVGQAGIFRLVGIPEDQIEPMLGIACPNILQSYAREAVSDASIRAGFPPVLIQPINFEGIYMARQQEQAAAQNGQGNTPLQ